MHHHMQAPFTVQQKYSEYLVFVNFKKALNITNFAIVFLL